MDTSSWYFILNPSAGGGKAASASLKFRRILDSEGIQYTYSETNGPGDAITLCRTAIKNGFRKILVGGGDGTLNEVANGILSQDEVDSKEITLAQFPLGTGNDWRRTWKIPKHAKKNIAMLKAMRTTFQDVGRIRFETNQEIWFVNVAGCGFDAAVANAANEQKKQGKSNGLTYILELIKTLKSYKERHVKVTIDDRIHEMEAFSILAGICNFAGNAMKLVPHAQPSGGKLSVVLVKRIARWKIILHFPTLFTGKFTRLKEVETTVCNSMEIQSSSNLFLQVDGESVGTLPVRIDLLAEKLRVLIP